MFAFLKKNSEKRKENGRWTKDDWGDLGWYIENCLVILVPLPNTRFCIGSFWISKNQKRPCVITS